LGSLPTETVAGAISHFPLPNAFEKTRPRHQRAIGIETQLAILSDWQTGTEK